MPTQKQAFVTGAAAGIGRGLALALAERGYSLTLTDTCAAGLHETQSLIKAKGGVDVQTLVVDVTDAAAQEAAMTQHCTYFGAPPDVCCLNAGIAEQGSFLDPSNTKWHRTIDVNLSAILTGTRAAAQVMKGRGGTILAVASAGATFPMPAAPVYAASKAGALHFVRSIAPGLARHYKVKIHCVCPEFVETALVRTVMDADPVAARKLMGRSMDSKLLTPEAVAVAALSLLDPSTPAGTALLIRQDGSLERPYASIDGGERGGQKSASSVSSGDSGRSRAAAAEWAAKDWPATYRKVTVTRLSNSFREATAIVPVPLPPHGAALPPGTLLLHRVFVGINASDINYTSGRYHGSKKAAEAKLPFDAGFESVSIVAAVGPGVSGFVPGDAVASLTYDGFGEWAALPAKLALKVPRASADVVAMLTSGLTASIALQEAARMVPGETVLVTAAAGGTGQFAVQLAKLAGCHVIATAGGPAKAAMLRALGADRVVDYKSEDLKTVLRKEYPKGVDVVYEGVGGAMFDAALANLADRGRLVVIGMMDSYSGGWPVSSHPGTNERLLWKSASVTGFFLLRFASHFRSHLTRLLELVDSGKLKVSIDPSAFVGIDAVPNAVAHLYSGRSVGKVVVQLSGSLPPPSAGGAVSRL
ncbi:hypothetical protein FOA52_013141 [Chlamydomonas sp. UWO 241]|nr:hypothetical protein FOA52_013141 [Chlamydomonas sp. UWO 241]